MPTRRPRTQAQYDPYEDFEENAPHQNKPVAFTLSDLITSRTIALGRPPRDEEDKRVVYEQLIRLKEQRYTHSQCASMLQCSERTIANYIADSLYKEIQSELVADAKQRGHLRIAEVIDEAVDTLYTMMKSGKSEFVRYKAAEKLLDVAGYNLPREEAHLDSREGLSRFLAEVESRRARTIVNIQVTSSPTKGGQVVEADVSPSVLPPTRSVPPELAPYYQRVLPGGKLPSRRVSDEPEGA